MYGSSFILEAYFNLHANIHPRLWRKELLSYFKALITNNYTFIKIWYYFVYADGTTKKINEKGIEYYNKLIDKLLENGNYFSALYYFNLLYHFKIIYNLQLYCRHNSLCDSLPLGCPTKFGRNIWRFSKQQDCVSIKQWIQMRITYFSFLSNKVWWNYILSARDTFDSRRKYY